MVASLIMSLAVGVVSGYSVYQHEVENREGIICLKLGVIWEGVEEYEERWGDRHEGYASSSKIIETSELRTIRIHLQDPEGDAVDTVQPRTIHKVTFGPLGCISAGYLELLEITGETTSGIWHVVWEDDGEEVFSEAFRVVALGEMATMVVQFPWSQDPLLVDYSPGYETFVYTSAYSLDAQSWSSSVFRLFKYFEEGLWYGRDSIVVLDPGPPGGEDNTFLDLSFNGTLMAGLEEYVGDALSDPNIVGFVLGDEWPRGLNDEEVTVGKLARYNETYHDETGLWMRLDPDLEGKKALADWFYDRSIEAWNRLAASLRRRFPDALMGTSIDLVWEPDYSRADVAHWRCRDWWEEVNLDFYDFVVTHYYTGMNLDQESPGVAEKLDRGSVARLRLGLESLLDPAANKTRGLDVFLMLGAHCQYPYIITPMQMVAEWNTALEFRDRLAAVGWFTFDVWGGPGWSKSITGWDNYAPLREDRLLTVNWLGRLSRYGACTGEVVEDLLLQVIILLHLGLLSRFRNGVGQG